MISLRAVPGLRRALVAAAVVLAAGAGASLWGILQAPPPARSQSPLDSAPGRPPSGGSQSAGPPPPCPDLLPVRSGRVCVVPDVQKGLATFADMMREVRALDPDLCAFTGDMASHADGGHYRLFLRALAREAPDRPLLFAPGNHDCDPHSDAPTRTDLFERAFGPRLRAARVGDALFVTLDDASAPPDASALAALDARLHAAPEARVRVALFHVPPFDENGRPRPELQPLHRLLRDRGVTIAICGHRKGWRDAVIDGVRYVENGEGADYADGLPRGFARFVELRVAGDAVLVVPHDVPRRLGVLPVAEHLAIAHPGRLAAGTGAAALLVALLVLAASRRRTTAASRP